MLLKLNKPFKIFNRIILEERLLKTYYHYTRKSVLQVACEIIISDSLHSETRSLGNPRDVRDYLDDNLPNRWIGRMATTEEAKGLPELILIEFSFMEILQRLGFIS